MQRALFVFTSLLVAMGALSACQVMAQTEKYKDHAALTAETRAFMEEYFEIHQSNDVRAIDKFMKYYSDDVQATYYHSGGVLRGSYLPPRTYGAEVVINF